MSQKKETAQKTYASLIINTAVPILLQFLVFVVLLGFFGGIIKTLIDLTTLFHQPLEQTFHQLLFNVITLLAVIEVIRTILSYLTDGRVRVTFVVDTVLIVMLNEVISLWFKGAAMQTMGVLLVTIGTLIAVRTVAIRFSPDGEDKV